MRMETGSERPKTLVQGLSSAHGLKEAAGQLLVDLHLCSVQDITPCSAVAHTLSLWKRDWEQSDGA